MENEHKFLGCGSAIGIVSVYVSLIWAIVDLWDKLFPIYSMIALILSGFVSIIFLYKDGAYSRRK